MFCSKWLNIHLIQKDTLEFMFYMYNMIYEITRFVNLTSGTQNIWNQLFFVVAALTQSYILKYLEMLQIT